MKTTKYENKQASMQASKQMTSARIEAGMYSRGHEDQAVGVLQVLDDTPHVLSVVGVQTRRGLWIIDTIVTIDRKK
jgi:hypothetical protein